MKISSNLLRLLLLLVKLLVDHELWFVIVAERLRLKAVLRLGYNVSV